MPFSPRRRLHRALLISASGAALLFSACRGGNAVEAVISNSAHPSIFSANACQKYQPTDGNQHHTVFIDPGHGGPDPGAGGTTQDGSTINEKDATLAVALKLSTLLRQNGYTVVLARTADTSVVRPGPDDTVAGGGYSDTGDHADLLARIDCANSADADLLLSIHFNSYGDPSVGGTETMYDDDRPFSAESERFAQLVQQDVVDSLHTAGWDVPDRGIAADSTDDEPALTPQGAAYPHLIELGPASPGYLDTPSAMPGALCESLFLTDPFEASIAAGQQGQQVIAEGMSKAVQAYFASMPATQTPAK